MDNKCLICVLSAVLNNRKETASDRGTDVDRRGKRDEEAHYLLRRLIRAHQPLPPQLSQSVGLATNALSVSFLPFCRGYTLPDGRWGKDPNKTTVKLWFSSHLSP